MRAGVPVCALKIQAVSLGGVAAVAGIVDDQLADMIAASVFSCIITAVRRYEWYHVF